MAAKVPAPKELNIDSCANVAEAWRRWKREFEFFLVATESNKKSDEVKTSILLTCIGQRSREVYYNFKFENEGDCMKLDVVLEQFDAHFCPKSNITFLRFKFFNVKQQENQPVDDFVNELKTKAQECEFKELTEGLIRDRIVCGINSLKLQERLLRESDLTLDKAILLCKAEEDTQKQAKEIQKRSSETDNKVESVRFKRNSNRNNKSSKQVHSKHGYNKSESGKLNSKACKYCGKLHEKGHCPAYGKVCSACGKQNHFAAVCLSSKRVKLVHVENTSSSTDSDDNEFFIGAVFKNPKSESSESELSSNNSESNNSKVAVEPNSYIVDVVSSEIDNLNDIYFKLDTGAQCNIIPRNVYNQIPNKPKLHKTKDKLTSYDGSSIEVEGKCIVRITKPDEHNGKSYPVQCFVVPTNSPAILGLDTCKRLNLIKRVMTIHPNTPDYLVNYEDVFGELGVLDGEHHICLDPSVKPVVDPPRKIPYLLKEKVKIELNRMLNLGIISKVEEPTEWVSSIVVVEKPNGNIRICIDPKNLNEAIQREHFPMQTADDIMAEMAGAQYFSKLDASAGYWQVKLDDSSSKLLTFQTPFGRYKFNRLPFGVKTASEIFQRRIVEIIEGLEGCANSQDDIIVWGRSRDEHDARLKNVLDRIQAANLKLNREKCIFAVQQLTFLGHTFTAAGVKPDGSKVKAITNMPVPESKENLRRFMGMVTYLGKFIPGLSTITSPLRQLMQDEIPWHWNNEHDKSFESIKQLVTQSPVLKYYDSKLETKVSVDASKCGLGGVLLQKHGNEWFPVAYASRAMTVTERNYAQIEKEALAIVFGTNKFHDYLYGKEFVVETDNKPLQSIFAKSITKAPPRIQRFLLRLQRYNFTIEFIPGRHLYIADMVSRAYLQDVAESEVPDIEYHVHAVISNLPISTSKFEEFKQRTLNDLVSKEVMTCVRDGWPQNLSECSPTIKPYFQIRDELSIVDGVLLKGDRVVVPSSMR